MPGSTVRTTPRCSAARPALERMTSGYVADLARVREYLDGELHR